MKKTISEDLILIGEGVLDKKDRQILYQLDVDARQSYAEISKKVGLSKEVVNYRIKQLEQKGIIKGYYAVLDIAKLGFLNFRVFLKFYNTTPEKEEEILDYLMRHPSVGWLVSVQGSWDTNMLVWAENIFKFEEFWNEFMHKYRNYIEKKWISIVTKLLHYRKAYLFNLKKEDEPVEVSGGELKVIVDEVDWQILRILAPDARTSLLSIAENLKMSPEAISYRIKQLEKKGVILSYRALLDLEKIGARYFKVHFYLQNMNEQKEKELFAYARYNPNIIFVDITVGGADFEIELHVKNNTHFRTILEDMKRKFSGIIRNYESFLYYKEYKWVYLPI